jgi:hypothetical protein
MESVEDGTKRAVKVMIRPFYVLISHQQANKKNGGHVLWWVLEGLIG